MARRDGNGAEWKNGQPYVPLTTRHERGEIGTVGSVGGMFVIGRGLLATGIMMGLLCAAAPLYAMDSAILPNEVVRRASLTHREVFHVDTDLGMWNRAMDRLAIPLREAFEGVFPVPAMH
ncbi:MAG: hypothetical protein LLG93_14835 [Deltaproteobacteria bacterium]|nr:hypothetical protein [Deltaproteobacteria bacterium]